MGRRYCRFPPIVLALIVVCLGLSRVGVVHAARTMAFGGGTDQNLFQIQLQYCEDGIEMAVQQQAPISTDAADLGSANAHFSLQLMAATPAVTRVLPYPDRSWGWNRVGQRLRHVPVHNRPGPRHTGANLGRTLGPQHNARRLHP